jgi:hypothetical protein
LEGKYLAILLTWALGALSFCVLAAPQTRYGAALYAFLPLFFAYFWTANPGTRAGAFITIGILLAVTIWKLASFMLYAGSNATSVAAPEQALYKALASLPQDGRAIYVVNAPGMYSAPKYLAPAWDIKDRIVFINQFVGCSQSKANDWRYSVSRTSLSSLLPACATYVFSTVPTDVTAKAIGGQLTRPGIGLYHFPNGRMTAPAGPGKNMMSFGRELEFKFDTMATGRFSSMTGRQKRMIFFARPIPVLRTLDHGPASNRRAFEPRRARRLPKPNALDSRDPGGFQVFAAVCSPT